MNRLLLITAVLGRLSAATYYVSTSGNDANLGTLASPFRHVTKGTSAAVNPGDSVIVMDGTYDNEGVVGSGNYVVTLTHSGASGNPITIAAQNRGKAILDSMNTATGTTCNGAGAYFNLYNAAFVVIQGFVIQRGCDSGIQSNDAAHDIAIRWNEIHHIANHTVTDQYGRDGIYLNGNEYNFAFDGNVFHDIGRTDGVPLMHFDHGIYAAARNLTVVNNVFYNMNRGYSIQQSDGAANWQVTNNTIVGGIECQVMFWNRGTNITTRNNVFYNPGIPAICQFTATTTGAVDHNLNLGTLGSTSGMMTGSNLTGNPLFVSATDFHLQAGSPAIGAGVSGVDLGAFHYSNLPPPPPPPAPKTSTTCSDPVAIAPGKFTFTCTVVTQ